MRVCTDRVSGGRVFPRRGSITCSTRPRPLSAKFLLRKRYPPPFLERVNQPKTMPRVTPAQSDSESERVPSKKQKKKAESPVDDPMDQDEEDRDQEPGEENKGEEDEEYEIEEILDRSYKIFKDVCPSVGFE